MNNVILGQYIKGNSYIYKLDPRVKIIALITLIISLFVIQSLLIVGIFLAVLTVVFITSGIPILKMIKGLKPILFILIFTFFIQIIYTKDSNPPLADLSFSFSFTTLMIMIVFTVFIFFVKKMIKFKMLLFLFYLIGMFLIQYFIKNDFIFRTDYHLTLYETALNRSVFILIRVFSVVSLSSLLTFTTMPLEVNNALESLLKPFKIIKLPADEIAMMMSITLRFIPTLFDESQKIMKAQASRGVDFNEGKLKQKVTQIISLLIPMFVISFNRAEDLADAMESRGYIIGSKRSKYDEMKYRLFDYVTYVLVFIVLGLSIYSRFI